MVKDTAIFKAHRAVPIVIATEGEQRFDPYAETVLHVPEVPAGLSPLLNTLAGHLWGYYAALSIHEESRHLFAFREAIRQQVAAAVGQERDLYEIVLADTFREQVAAFERVFKDKLRQDRYATALSIQTASDLTLLLKYMAGRDTSTIALEQKAGSSARLPSRVESDTRLRGTKRIIVQNGNVFMGKGRRDQRSILVIPILSTATTLDYLLLLHVAFRPEVALDKKVAALGGKYHHIRHLVEETRLAWHDAYVNRLEMEELFGESAEKVSERILAGLRTESAAAIVSSHT